MWQHRTISALVAFSSALVMSQSSRADVPTNNPLLSPEACIKAFDNALTLSRSGELKPVSEAEQSFLRECQALFPAPDASAPLPTVSQCIDMTRTVFEQGFASLMQSPEPQLRSITRCREVIQAYYIPSGSMLPTLQINDRLILDKTAYQNRSPQRGDIVLFEPTEALTKQNFNLPFTKRIIGLPGEKIEVKKGQVLVNGKPLKEAYIQERPMYEWGPVIVPASSYVVFGDNRNNAYDSHYWGFVPRQLILGRFVWRFYPLNRAGSLSQ
jgi:signal peptidase I